MARSHVVGKSVMVLATVLSIVHTLPAASDAEVALKGLYHATTVEDLSVRQDALMCLQWLSAAEKRIPAEWVLPFLGSEDEESRLFALVIIADLAARLDDQQLRQVISLAKHRNVRFAQEVGRIVESNGERALGLLTEALKAEAQAAESSLSSYAFGALSSPLDGARGLWKAVAAAKLQTGNAAWAIEHVRQVRSAADREIANIRFGFGLSNKEKAVQLLEYASDVILGLSTAPETDTTIAFLSSMLSDEWLGSSALLALLQIGQRDGSVVVKALEPSTGTNALFVKATFGHAPSVQALRTVQLNDDDAFKWSVAVTATGDRELTNRCDAWLASTRSLSVASSCAKALIQRALAAGPGDAAESAAVKAAVGARLAAEGELTEGDIVGLLRHSVKLSQMAERQEAVAVLAVCQLAAVHLAEKTRDELLEDLLKDLQNLTGGGAQSPQGLLQRAEQGEVRVRTLASFDVTDPMERLLVFDVLATAIPLFETLLGEGGDEAEKERRLKELVGKVRDTGLVQSDREFVDGVVAAIVKRYGKPQPRLASALRYTLTRSAADVLLDVAANSPTAPDAIRGLAIAMAVPTDELVGFLDDSQDNLRFHVAMALGKRADRSVVTELEAHLARETVPRVRVALRYAICALG